MLKSMKTLWLKALRSGKYKQGTGTLETTDGKYCCLGVLTKIDGGECEHHHYLDPDRAKRLRLPGQVQQDLAQMNDRRVSFRAIANYIEKNL